MTPRRSTRRSILATLGLGLALALAPRAAHADVAYEPPPRLAVRASVPNYTTAPTSVVLSVTNTTSAAIVTQGVRLIVLTGGVRVPLRVTGVQVDGRPTGVWSDITFAPGARVQLRIDFDEVPATALAVGHIDFALRLGHTAESTFSMARAGR